MGVKEELHRMIDLLGDDELDDALDYLQWLARETDTATDEELAEFWKGKQEVDAGDYVTLDELKRARTAP